MHIKNKLNEIANKYPKALIKEQILDIERTNFHINLAINSFKSKLTSDLSICDLGGGVGIFSVGCAGNEFKRTVLIDDFKDPINLKLSNECLELHKEYGVEIYSRNIVEKKFWDIEGTFDIITSFDSMEHWHNSPKKLFHEVMEKLNYGGVFILGVPNCKNLRKRISIPMGLGKWSSMESWYEEENFRGHVREPDVADLMYIAKDMSLNNVKIVGRNWLGYSNKNAIIRICTKIIEPILNKIPTLCSDIYLIGKKNY